MSAVSSAAYVEQNLRKGAVIYLHDPNFSPKPHYFVILNDAPTTDPYLIMACATSQAENRRASIVANDLSVGSLVEVLPEEYSVFTQPTVFDCNYPVYRIKHFLIKQHKRNKLRFISDPLPVAVLRRLCMGIQGSRLVEPKYKKMAGL